MKNKDINLTSLAMGVRIKKLHKNAVIPTYAKPGDAGMDLTATSVEIDKDRNISYGTGLAMEIPKGYVGLIFPRSSISKMHLSLANAVGVIDSGYRGEIICKFKPTKMFDNLKNSYRNWYGFYMGHLSVTVYEVGDRVAQIVILPIPSVTFIESDELGDSERSDGGFGSTGI